MVTALPTIFHVKVDIFSLISMLDLPGRSIPPVPRGQGQGQLHQLRGGEEVAGRAASAARHLLVSY